MDENSSSTAQCFIQESGRILCLLSQLSAVTLRRRGGARNHDGFVPLHARCSQEKSVVLPLSVLVAMAGKEQRLFSVFTLPIFLFFSLFGCGSLVASFHFSSGSMANLLVVNGVSGM
jgi:hypothetical protein